MKVVYDISILGSSRYDQRARTGIFRVVESLARQLAASPACELVFSGISCPHDSRAYLESDAELGGIEFLLSQPERPVAKALSQLNSQINDAPAPPGWNIPVRGFRNLLWRTHRYFASLPPLPIEVKIPRDAEIFHSPLCPLPEQTKRFRGLKRFLTVYDLIPILHPQFFEEGEDRFPREILGSLDREDWVLCISESCREDLCGYLPIDPEHVFVTPLAADPVLFYPCADEERRRGVREKCGIPDAPYILSLCSLRRHKNIDHLIRSFGRLVRQEGMEDLFLVLVGTKNWNEGTIYDAIAELGPLGERVLVTGYVADEDLAPLYSGALAFVFPSFYEGFGLPPLEAMQCGVPVITSNTSSLPEVVGDAGVMLEPRDEEGLCQSLLDLYQKPSLREAMARRSLEQAALFSWERCAAQTIAAYRTALEGRRSEPLTGTVSR